MQSVFDALFHVRLHRSGVSRTRFWRTKRKPSRRLSNPTAHVIEPRTAKFQPRLHEKLNLSRSPPENAYETDLLLSFAEDERSSRVRSCAKIKNEPETCTKRPFDFARVFYGCFLFVFCFVCRASTRFAKNKNALWCRLFFRPFLKKGCFWLPRTSFRTLQKLEAPITVFLRKWSTRTQFFATLKNQPFHAG